MMMMMHTVTAYTAVYIWVPVLQYCIVLGTGYPGIHPVYMLHISSGCVPPGILPVDKHSTTQYCTVHSAVHWEVGVACKAR